MSLFYWHAVCWVLNMDYKYKKFEDLAKIDPDLANCFRQKGEAVRWCMAVEGPIAQWIKSQERGEGGKALYELVWFASERKGIVEKDIARNKRARLLTTFCPDAFRTAENAMSYDPAKEAKALTSSMEHCKYIIEIKNFNRLFDASNVRRYVNEIETIIDNQQLPPPPESQTTTIEERVETFLRNDVVEHGYGTSYQRIDVKKDFGDGIVPGLSVSVYHSKEFYDDDKPSHVEAYEFVKERLSTEKIYAYVGKYESKRNIKLFVVSPYGFDKEVISLAEDKYIGLVLVNMNEEMSQESYIVQRSIEDYSQRQFNMDVLSGRHSMNSALMIYDAEKCCLTSSLADSLVSNGIAVYPDRIIRAPYLSNPDIEEAAEKITRDQVQKYLSMLHQQPGQIYGYPDKHPFEIDPYAIAKEQGITCIRKEMSSRNQLGYLDVKTGNIYLKPLCDNYPRERFTLAHELGHYMLHLAHLRKNNYTSVGETSETIGECKTTISKGELKWYEHHANVEALYKQLHNQYIHQIYGDEYGPLYYNPLQKETWSSYNILVGNMAMIFNVSQEAMQIRLKKLGHLKMPPES